jgi:hypothetical protein
MEFVCIEFLFLAPLCFSGNIEYFNVKITPAVNGTQFFRSVVHLQEVFKVENKR